MVWSLWSKYEEFINFYLFYWFNIIILGIDVFLLVNEEIDLLNNVLKIFILVSKFSWDNGNNFSYK